MTIMMVNSIIILVIMMVNSIMMVIMMVKIPNNGYNDG